MGAFPCKEPRNCRARLSHFRCQLAHHFPGAVSTIFM
jgi:hypothetical protein